MHDSQPKGNLSLMLLQLLEQHTDAQHRLSQREISDLFERTYHYRADRKTIKRGLLNLVEGGYPVEYAEHTRGDELVCTDWYLERSFTDAELRLLMDSVLFSRHIPAHQCKELLGKIKGLGSRHFQSHLGHVQPFPNSMRGNKQLFMTIELLDEAISHNCQVEFLYNDYYPDKKPHPRTDADGAPKVHTVSPYRMVIANGRYYLIANHSRHDNIIHYRLDRITEMHVLDTPAKPKEQVKGLERGLDLPRHMAEHIYMFGGDSGRVVMRIQRHIVGELVDWFGDGVTFMDNGDNYLLADVLVNLNAIYYWALQYLDFVEVLEPQGLRDDIAIRLANSMKEYSE